MTMRELFGTTGLLVILISAWALGILGPSEWLLRMKATWEIWTAD